jgi:hypothetical protein
MNIIVDNLELDYNNEQKQDKGFMMIPAFVHSRYVKNINVNISYNQGSSDQSKKLNKQSFLGKIN